MRQPSRSKRRLLALVVCLPAIAAAEPGSSPVLVRAGFLLDVEQGVLLADQLIRIEAGRIAAVSPAGTAEAPAGVLDLTAYTVLPGLIDVHTHLCDNTYLGEEWDWWAMPIPAFGAAGAANAAAVLRAGFTTVRNASEFFYCGVAIRDAVARGWIDGPRIFASGPMISITGGHGAPGNWMAPQHQPARQWGAVADGVDEVRREVRTQIKHGVDWIKIAATGGFGSAGTVPGASSFTVEELRAAVEEAGKRGLAVAAHAHGADGIRSALSAGVRSIEHGSLMDASAIESLLETGAFLVPDLLAAHYDLVEVERDWSDKGLGASNAEFYRAYAERVGRAHRAGVRIAFGTDSSVYPHGRNAEQFALLVEAGLEPIAALRSATVVAAQLLGIEDEVGSIAVGKRADLIAVRGNPLTAISTLTEVVFVMKAGEVERVP